MSVLSGTTINQITHWAYIQLSIQKTYWVLAPFLCQLAWSLPYRVDPSKLQRWDTELFLEMEFPYPIPEQQEPVKPSVLTWCFPSPSHCRAYNIPQPQIPTVETSLYHTPDLPWLQPCPTTSAILHRLRWHSSPASAEGSLVQDAGASAPHRSTFVLASCPPLAGLRACVRLLEVAAFLLPLRGDSVKGRDDVQPLVLWEGLRNTSRDILMV